MFNYSFTSSSFCFRAELDLFHELSLSRYFGPILPVDPVVNNKTDNVSDSCDTRRVEAQILSNSYVTADNALDFYERVKGSSH